MNQPCHRQPVLRLLVLDGVSARDGRAHGAHDIGAPAQDLRHHVCGQVGWERGDVQREQHVAAHRVDVAQCVRRGDRAVLVGGVDDRREKVHRLDQRLFVVQPVHGRVVGRAEPYQQVRMVFGWEEVVQGAQHLRELLSGQLGRSAGARA